MKNLSDVSVYMSDDANIVGPETGIHIYTYMKIHIYTYLYMNMYI
jgi:hypothetical protein